MTLAEILRQVIAGANLHAESIEMLLAFELADTRQASFLSLQARAELFRYLWPRIREKCRESGILSEDYILVTGWRLWLPLAIELRDGSKPAVQGILAPQGTGKTTLTTILRVILEALGLKALALSLDDLYKTRAERLKVREEEPRLLWRGPPGTHDVALGIHLLDRFRSGARPLALPRFNKALYGGQGERLDPEIVEDSDIILFEGWFLGVRPVEERVFENPPEPIDTPEDVRFARDCNRRLQAYLPLWERVDRLPILYPLDYRWSLQWRQEAEPAGGMSHAEIERFVKYFWRALHPALFLPPLLERADRVVEVREDRSLGGIKNRIVDV